jgi:hypothetical protein
MKLSNWVVLSLALALTASLVVARTWPRPLPSGDSGQAQASSPTWEAPSAEAAMLQPQPPPVENESEPPAQEAPPQPVFLAAEPPMWTVTVVRGQEVEQVHYSVPLSAAPR